MPSRRSPQDELFERALFASASSDAPPEGAARLALARFTSDVAALKEQAPAAAPIERHIARTVGKWLAAGSLLGAALVAAYLAGRVGLPVSTSSTSPTASLQEPVASVTRPSSRLEPPPATVASPPPPRSVSPAPARPASTRSASDSLPRAPAPGSLRDELARLDAARTALAIGNFDAVARELARYEQDYPRGVLAREADLVAITALSEKGDRVEALRRARRFLARYPRDVHADRVKQLVAVVETGQ